MLRFKSSYKDGHSFQAWIYSIVCNLQMDHWRKKRFEAEWEEGFDAPYSTNPQPPAPVRLAQRNLPPPPRKENRHMRETSLCPTGERQLAAYLENRLNRSDRDQFREHANLCAICREEIQIWDKLSNLPTSTHGPYFRQDFEAMLARESRHPPSTTKTTLAALGRSRSHRNRCPHPHPARRL